MALNRNASNRLPARAAGRQAIFLGATEPRAARPRKPRRGATLVGQGRLAVSISGDHATFNSNQLRYRTAVVLRGPLLQSEPFTIIISRRANTHTRNRCKPCPGGQYFS